MVSPAASRPHPWSEGFHWVDHSPPYRRVTEAQAQQFDELGFFLLEDAISAEAIDELIAAIDPLEARTVERLRRPGVDRLISDPDAITFSGMLVDADEVLRRFASSQLFRDLGHDLIGPDVRLYWDQAVYKKPEPVREFPWHQDNGYGFLRPEAYLTCWIPLVDATVGNGCPWVVPGVHRRGTLVHSWTPAGFQCFEGPSDAVPVEAPAGSIVVFSSLTPHRTGPNITDMIRKAYILQYAPTDAVRLKGEPGEGEPDIDTVPPTYGFPVLVAGGAP